MRKPAYEFTKRTRPLAFAVTGLILLGACGGNSMTTSTMDDGASSPTTSSPTADPVSPDADEAAEAAGGGDSITIANFAYDPPTLVVETGSEITVTNTDDVPHTLTAKDKAFDTGNLTKGQSATVKIEGSGEIAYFCTIHEYMTGVIRAES